MSIRFTLKVLLAKNDMTQKELAQKTGIRPPTISAICNGTIKELPVGVLDRICSVLKCSVGDFLEFEEDEKKLSIH